jgi:ribosomal protein S18 acetylase RimI-like enzyme
MKKEITFRKAELADALRLSVLYKQVYIQTYATEGVTTEFANFISKQFAVEKIENTIINHPDNIILAVYKDNLVGVAEIELNKKCPVNNIIGPELNKLYVLEWFCGMGVGHGLLKEIEKIVSGKGIKEMWLWVYILNERAISFYERQGYQWIGNAFFQMEFNKYENKVLVKKL